MLKGFLGLFGKKSKSSEDEAKQQPVKQPFIPTPSESTDESLNNPVDIISKLAQINSIIGQNDGPAIQISEEIAIEDSGIRESIPEYLKTSTIAPPIQTDSIQLPAEMILKKFPSDILNSSVEEIIAKYGKSNNFVFTFQRTDLMYGLSLGKLEMKLGELVNKIPLNIFSATISLSYDKLIELPLIQILPFIPPTWFIVREQDRSKEKMVSEMEDLFPSIPMATPSTEHNAPGALIPETTKEINQETALDSDNYQSNKESLNDVSEISDKSDITSQIGIHTEVESQTEGVQESANTNKSYDGDIDDKLDQTLTPKEIRKSKPLVSEEDDDLGEIKSVQSNQIDEHITFAEEETLISDSAEIDTLGNIHQLEISQIQPASEIVPKPVVTTPAIPPTKPSTGVDRSIQPIKQSAEHNDNLESSLENREVEELSRKIFQPRPSFNDTLIKDQVSIAETAQQIEWRSQAPNGIDINHSGIDELCLLAGVGEHLAQEIINYRTLHGPYLKLQDLLNVPGLGNHTYKNMTKMTPKSSIKQIELHINEIFEIESQTISLGKITQTALSFYGLDAIIVSSIDGLVLAKSSISEDILRLTENLAAVAPQLYKRAKKSLKQGSLPEADMFTFYLGKNSITFSGTDQIFIIFIHGNDYPSARQLKQCRSLTTDLVWYCSYRAVIS